MVTYRYDLAGRLKGVSDNSASIASAVAPGGAVAYAASYAYDNLNRPTNVTWSPAATAATPATAAVTFGHAYNRANQRSGQTATDNSWWLYPGTTASTVSYTANTLNQYSAVGAVAPTYDGNGNLTFDGTFTYGYDAENRLTAVTQGGTTIATYAFDAQGRRKLKTVGATTTVYVTDASNREVLEYNGSNGQILRWNAYGLGANDVLNQMNVVAATRATFIPDIQGSMLATLDSGTGTLTKTGYLPYGKSASTPASFGYTGQRADPETNGLYYYRARMYLPAWGRFMQADPVGYAAGSNLYAYVGNDPLNFTDPSGLDQNRSGSVLGQGTADVAAYAGQQLTQAGAVRDAYVSGVAGLDPNDSLGRSALKQAAREATPSLIGAPLEAMRPNLGPGPGSISSANVSNPGVNALGTAFRYAGPALLAASVAYDVYDVVSSPQHLRTATQATFGFIGGIGGGIGGAFVGGIGGTLVGGPGVGTAIGTVGGGFAGSAGGGYYGRQLGGAAFDKINSTLGGH